MTATNHALTGALIGLSVGHPVALLIALGSHFVLDAIPHYTDEELMKASSKNFAILLVVEACICAGIVLLLLMARPEHWLLGSVCAFLATSPDFMWIPRFVRARRGQTEPKLKNVVMRFHNGIQWFARPIGAFVELAWCVGAFLLLANMI